MKITANQLKTIIKEELANMAGHRRCPPLTAADMRWWKRKQEPTLSDQINEVIIDVLRQEGGAAGYDPIKDAVVKSAGMEKAFDEMLKMVILAHPNVAQHEDGDYIETSGLK